MTADAIRDPQSVKTCCATLQDRYSKLEEKRNALRQAVKLLEHQIDVLQSENIELKKDTEKERKQAKLEREEKENECNLKCKLEQELSSLKAEIAILKEKGCSRGQKDWEAEVKKLLELLEKERAQSKLEREYKEKESKIKYKLENEISILRAEISTLKENKCSRSQEDWEAEVKDLQLLLEKERIRGDSAQKKAELEKKKAAEAWKLLKLEKSKVEESHGLTGIERKRVDEIRACSETLKFEAREAKEDLLLERSKVEEANRRADAEKQKANREKKRADLKSVKAEEQKRYADRLAQQLSKEREKVDALQKEIKSLVSEEKECKNCSCSGAKGNLDKKILKKLLKEEKIRARQSKRSSKLEKVQEYLLKEELSLLKKDALQISRRLCVLEGCLSQGFEGINGSEKIGGECRRLCDFDSNYQPSDAQVGGLHCQDDNELVKSQYSALSDFRLVGAAVDFAMPLLPVSRGSNSQLISGISSELESLVGGSIRNKSQNSGMHSISTSISDRKLVGSQGRGAFSNLTEKSTQDHSKEGSTKKKHNVNVGLVAESGDRILLDKEIIAAHSNSTLLQNEVEEKTVGRTRKRKRVRDDPKEKKLLLKIEKKLNALHQTFCQKNDMLVSFLSQRDGNSEPIRNGDSVNYTYSRPNMFIKRRKLDSVQEVFSPPLDEDLEQYLTKELEIKGNYMKLLEMDDEADEERYRISIRMPLSPTLPEVESPRHGISTIDETDYLVEQGLMAEVDRLDQSYTFDVIDVEINSNKLKFRSLETIHGLSFNNIICPCNVNEEALNEENGVYQSVVNERQILSIGDKTAAGKSTYMYFVLFPNMKDDTIRTILSAMDNFVSQRPIFSRTDRAVSEILHAVASQGYLSPEEKACLFFSLLLYNVSAVASLKSSGFKNVDISDSLGTFAQEISKDISYSELNFSFTGICEAHILLTLIEDFLLNRTLLVYDGIKCRTCTQSESSSKVILRDDKNVFMSSISASIEQLMAGAIILASLCTAFGHIGFICEASHNIARTCRDDSTLVLSVLHVFASICGREYLMASTCPLIMITIKSIVSQLERGPETVESQCKLSQCGQCPFGEGEASIDKVAFLLLDKLQEYAKDETCHLHLKRAEEFPRWDWIYDRMILRLLRILETLTSAEVSAAILILIGQLGRFGMEAEGCEMEQIEEIVCSLSKFLHLDTTEKMDLATQFAAASALVNFLSLEYKELFHRSEELIGGTSQSGQAIVVIRMWFCQLMHEQQLLVLSLFQSTDVHNKPKEERKR
ncbi:uncharacterized protein [Aristolochia californica]|uniref:uncharacterized protein isoform X2 n=1 Tax=Aristolochia californica TaxID=171875 RepID=UPI0035DE6EFA